MKDLPSLESFTLGGYSFAHSHSIRFESENRRRVWLIDLPNLQSINLSEGAFQGDMGDDRKSLYTAPYNYLNTLIMKSDEWEIEW